MEERIKIVRDQCDPSLYRFIIDRDTFEKTATIFHTAAFKIISRSINHVHGRELTFVEFTPHYVRGGFIQY